ncbi:hypothetical protein AB1Y20_007886 [Prymnesium parvum]|uniref:PX domain-containing protein n=1 Tax=Prymnesium parvum TaxID=97485 RepID=A0AB34IV09_PRYPA
MAVQYVAQLSSFHTANPDNNPFTVYVVTVQKGANQWQVFRRYKEWEELRTSLCQTYGSAPPMPPKHLFGRMRPEVIESRVLGLNHFLQMLLSSAQYATTREVIDFLERDQNIPPPGLDLSPTAAEAADSAAADKTPEGIHKQQLKQIVEAASQNFISLSLEVAPLDKAYLQERAKLYSLLVQPAPGVKVPLRRKTPTVANDDATALVSSTIEAMFASPTPSNDDIILVQKTAAALANAVTTLAVQGKHEILVDVTSDIVP